MPIPSLIVGLGGTGQWVTAYVKKNLLDTHSHLPKEVKILAFDTLTKPEAQVGGRGENRAGGRTTGAVGLDSGEYFYIGGHVRQFIEEIAKGDHDHIGSWFQADWYLRTLSDHMFSITEGAGQFRQFGRLAVFNDVAAPSNSRIYNPLQDAILKLKQNNPTAKQLHVFLTGSLAGGTGAGMFVDMAHLIRQIAAQPTVDFNVTIRGFLVLPDAFSRNVDSGMLRSMYARAFAAMRENRRFAVNFDYAKGYPMAYHSGGGHPLWHGAVKGRLFDILNYIDAQRQRLPLSGTPMELGVAPTIADTIVASIDGLAGPVLIRHAVNIEQEATSRRGRGQIREGEALFGSIGTYSIFFPIYQIVENWSHQLGLEILDILLAPETKDDKSKLPTSLRKNANQESAEMAGRDDAVLFIASSVPVSYEGTTIEPTLLMAEIARVSREAKSRNSGIVGQLMARDIAAWNESFVPTSEDTETRRIKQRVERILQEKFSNETKTSADFKPEENAALGAERIADDARLFKNRYLGTEDARTGQRSGGQYRDALAEFTQYHAQRFMLTLDLKIVEVLNGRHNNPIIGKGGKIGYLRDFLEGLYEELSRTIATLDQVRDTRQRTGDIRKNAIANAQTAKQRMEKASGEKPGFMDLGRTFKNAISAQQGYIRAEEELIDILKVEATEEAVLASVKLMLAYVDSAVTAVTSWLDTLAFHKDGLYAALLKGKSQNETDRAAAKDIVVHKIVTDPAYEQSRYEHYLTNGERDRKNDILNAFHWNIDRRQVSGQPKLQLGLTLHGNSQRKLTSDEFSDNLSLLLGQAREVFTPAREVESVAKYLMEHAYRGTQGAIKLAEEIYEKSGVLLSYNGGNPLPANYLVTAYNDQDEGQQNYLRQVLQTLAQKNGVSTTVSDETEGGQKFARYLNSEDRFKLTLVLTQDLIELERITSYKSGRADYLGSADKATRGDRRMLHVLPAEVNAVYYENRLPALKQQVRLFSDDVTLQLEDISNVRLFLLLYTYGLIKYHFEKDSKGTDQRYWALILPPEREHDEYGNLAEPTEIRLTKLGDKRMLNALKTFNFEGRDIRYDAGYESPIDYIRVERALTKRREEDAAKRVENDTAGEQSQDIRDNYPVLAGDTVTLNEVKTEAARLDAIRELQKRIEDDMLPEYASALPSSQDDYDIASVFALLIRDEVTSVRDRLKNRIEVAIRINGGSRGKETLPPINTPDDYRDMW